MSDLSQVPTDQLLQMLQQHAATPIDPSEGGTNFRPLGIDTGLQMPQGVSRFFAGAGKTFSDIGQGAQQLMGGGPSPQEVQDRRAQDAPLMSTGAGMVGSAAPYLATAAIPGANSLMGATAVGAGAGALQPATSNTERLMNTGIGGAAGLGGQALGNALGRAITPITSNLSPEKAALAQAAKDNGIPLSTGQQTGSRPMQIMESVMENMPLTSSSQLAAKEAQKKAWNSAVLAKTGIQGDTATPMALATQKQALGSTFEDLAGRNNLKFTPDLVDNLSNIVTEANAKLPPDSAKRVSSIVNNVLDQVGQNDAMAGTNYQGWRTPLNNLAKSGDAESHFYGQIKKTLDAGFSSQLSGADQAAWKQASQQYGNLKSVMNAMGQAGADSKLGNISPAALESALTQAVGKEGKALGRGDLNPLVGVGRQFISDKTPDSFTAQRQFYTNLLTGQIAGAAPGAALGYATTGDSTGAMVGGLSGMGVGLGGPKLAQALMNSGAGKKYLTNSALSEPNRVLLSNFLRSLSVGGATALENK